MEYRMLKTEGFLRLLSVVFTALTACVIGLDTQTKVVFVEKKATVKDLSSLWVLTIAASVAGAYQLLQFCKCLLIGLSGEGNCRCSKGLSWVCLLLDQGFTYGMVCTTAAATQASLLAITGANSLQWRKVCSIFTRFCEQVGGGLACAFAASLAMSMLAAISGYRLFRNHYALKRAFPKS